mgnify:CR=1 FL=1
MLASSIKAVIFDMDGVLFESNNGHQTAFEATIAPHGLKDFVYSEVAGMRTDEALRQVFAKARRPLSDRLLGRLVSEKRHRALEILARDGQVMEGSNELIAKLRPRYRLALASSASTATIGLFLDKSTYGDAFEFCLDGASVVNAKPNPEIYQLAVSKLGLKPSQCLVIEDAVSGVVAAVAAGAPVIGLARTVDDADLLQSGALAVVSELGGIEPLLRS